MPQLPEERWPRPGPMLQRGEVPRWLCQDRP
ncbi:unnamed protein product [Linum tenue]|uniref:Uncharacterized protein n=1 Tax=Linum tenue TaxID=586396 RepID=A0AAV0KQ12_9ROSI|nr:unnamed protein product [Linum tenue]